MQDLVQSRFGVSDQPHSPATLLHHLGFRYQKARVVSDPRKEAKRLEWRRTKWPQMVHHARQRKALLLFGDAASLAQWGSLSYTWAPPGAQPEVPTSGKRKGYKVCGPIDSCSGTMVLQRAGGAGDLREL